MSTKRAWVYELAHARDNLVWCNWVWHLSDSKPNVPEGSIRNLSELISVSEVDELRTVRDEVALSIGDVMWDSHAEITKRTLKRWHKIIDKVIKGEG